MLQLIRLFTKLPAGLQTLLVDLVKTLITPGSNPEAAAKRLLEEHARVIAFDETMKRLKPR